MTAAPRTAYVLPAGLALLVGIDAGLTLLRVWSPIHSGRLGEAHGVLMVLGFIGTLIALERAVALGQRAGYLVPALFGLGALGLIAGFAPAAGVLVAGALGLCLLYVPLWRRQRDDAVLVSALGAVLVAGGTVLWSRGADLALVVPWLAGFVILTIAGERLELARLAMPAQASRSLLATATLICLSAAAATLWPAVGFPLLGAALLLLTWWLWSYDVARRTVRGTGLPRYIAVCMLAGQAWLLVAGLIWLVAGSALAAGEGRAYDAVVHAVFLGFALSMIMAHAPTILPAVSRVALPYRPVLYLPWAVLQLR